MHPVMIEMSFRFGMIITVSKSSKVKGVHLSYSVDEMQGNKVYHLGVGGCGKGPFILFSSPLKSLSFAF